MAGAIQLSVSDVRREILRAAGGPEKRASGFNALLGRLFHEVFADLMSGWPAGEEEWPRLREHIYANLLGPRINQHRAALQESGCQLVELWRATEELGRWALEIRRAAGPGALFSLVEQPLSWELREKGWTRPVRVSGIADFIVRRPETNSWCAVELKLGQTAPEADLAQACLYHYLLKQNGGTGALALVSFSPERQERLFHDADLTPATASLKDLIARMAGVLPGEGPLPPAAPPSELHRNLGRRIVQVLADYGSAVRLRGDPVAGPTFIRYTLMPEKGVRVAAVTNKADDLQIQLGFDAAPMIGKDAGRLVVDVQRPDRKTVHFDEIQDQLPPGDPLHGCSQVLLGVDLNGRVQFADLAQPGCVHLLVAGTSGSGKSEWLRAAIAGLISTNTPETLRLVLIDPKRSAFLELRDSPFLWEGAGLLHPPEDSASSALERLIDEMEARYRLKEGTGADTIAEYVAQTGRPVPRIICVCDEYADLIHAGRPERKEIESRIFRLGAKARAAAIHLVIATQYPNADTVGGALKANLAGRVCLKTTNRIHSQMMLEVSGAERLLGKGDLLYKDTADPIRLQSPYLTAEQRKALFPGSARED